MQLLKKELSTNTVAVKKAAEARMAKDLQSYDKKGKVRNVEIVQPNPQSLCNLKIFVHPSQDSLYRNTRIEFSFQAPDEYPHLPPKVMCISRIFHPNIDSQGNVCLNILKQDWKGTSQFFEIACGLMHLFQYLNNFDIEKPLDADAAHLMKSKPQQYKKVVADTCAGRSYNGRKFDNVLIKL